MMKNGVPFGGSEDRAFPALCVWIDRQVQKTMPDLSWSVYGGVCVTLAGVIAAISGNAEAMFGRYVHSVYVSEIWVAYFVLMGIYAYGIRSHQATKKESCDLNRGPYWRTTRHGLLNARTRGGLVEKFGLEGTQLLDRAAHNALRIDAALDSESWRASHDSIYSSAKSSTRQSVDAAMARLILLIDQSGVSPVVVQIADDISTLASEVEAITQSGEFNTTAESGLRETLNELREIRKATEEMHETIRHGD